MTLISSLKIERLKHKRRLNMLFLLVPLAVELFIIGSGFDTDKLSDGWMMQFYYMPLTNGMCLPVIISLYAGRIADIEHRGDCLKTLYTVMSKRGVFFTKLLYGLRGVSLMCVVEALILLLIGIKSGFGAVPVGDVFFWTLTSVLASAVLYWLQLMLSYFVRNQAVSICAGVVGSMAGMFIMFITDGVLLKLIPWGLHISGLFIRMDYDRATREMTFMHTRYPWGAAAACAVWLAVLAVVTLILLNRQDTESDAKRTRAKREHVRDAFGKMPVELLKLKGSPSWLALFALPLVSALIGTFNYRMNIEVLADGWYDLWSQHTLFLSFLFMPVAIGLFVSSIWRLEHTGTNWNIIGVLEKPLRLILGKFAASLVITCAALLWTTMLYIIAGKLAGIKGDLPRELPEWILLGMLGSAAICSVQTFLSIYFHSYMIPVGISCAGGFLGLMATAKSIPYILPWSLMSIGMRANNPHFVPDYPAFFAGTMLNIVLWLSVGYLYLKKADVRTDS